MVAGLRDSFDTLRGSTSKATIRYLETPCLKEGRKSTQGQRQEMTRRQEESRNSSCRSPNELMVFDNDGEVIVDHSSLFMQKAELEPVLVLDLIGLQVAKHSGSW